MSEVWSAPGADRQGKVDGPVVGLPPGHTGICSWEYSSWPSFSSRGGSASSASSWLSW